MTSHKGTCRDKADQTTHCSQRFYSSSCTKSSNGGMDTMNLNRKKAALESVKEAINNAEYLRPHRVETFLALVTNLPGFVENNIHYSCFAGKIVAEVDTSDPLSVHLRFSSGEEALDVYSVIDFWIEKGLISDEKFAALRVLEEISKIEQNKHRVITFGHADTITKLLIINRSEIDITVEEAKFAHIIFKILINIADTKERQIMLVENDLLDRAISFLKLLKKVEAANLKSYKEKSNRVILRAARDAGYKLLESYIHNFYDKDMKVTDYICSRHTLDLIMDGASKSLVTIASQVNPEEITIHDEIYYSPLCTVHAGEWKGQQVAVKVFDPRELSWNLSNFRKEVTMFTLVKHPNACPFFGSFVAASYENLPENISPLDKPLILMPFLKNGSLADYIKKRYLQLEKMNSIGVVPVIDISTLVNMAMNAANCIQFLHSRYIIHRDIKPANFLLDEHYVLRVTDFGVSRAMEGLELGKYTYSGTEVWMAPEVFEKIYDHKADTYSFGLVLWSMLTGINPYRQYEKSVNFAAVVASGKRESIPDFRHSHPDLTTLIKRCWDPDSKKRPDFTEILDILYNMQCPHTHRHYTHIYDSLEDSKFREIFLVLLRYMDTNTRTSFCLTNKKFNSLIKYYNQ